jgi:hypothetical protein
MLQILQPFEERRAYSGINRSVRKLQIRRGMTENHSFRNLVVWQRSMTLVEEIYRVTRSFPILGAAEHSKLQRVVEEVGRRLNGLITSMQPLEAEDS